MIKVNDFVINQDTFPDGSLLVKFDPNNFYDFIGKNRLGLTWKFENNAELWTIIALTKHLKSKGYEVSLYVPYLPNSRMDRVHNSEDVFTLKWFAEIINSLGFHHVNTLDVHSDVSTALIDRCYNESPDLLIQSVINKIEDIKEDTNELILYFPDNGAAKRYADMFPKYKYVVGMKQRDWETGKIKGLDIITNGVDLTGKTVLMVDDLASFGGTLYYSALKLKESGVGKIYAYTTHTENSVLNKEKGTFIKCLEDGTVEKLFTTNSLFTGEHEKIKIMNVI